MIVETLEKSDLDKNKLIVINNISSGFNDYKNEVLDYSGLSFEEAFNKYYKFLEENFKNFDNCCIFDFYKENLSANSLDIIRANVEEEEYEIIEGIYNKTYEYKHFYKVLDLNLLKVLLKISLKELYFVTFYFKGLTLWSNYNQKFVILKEK